VPDQLTSVGVSRHWVGIQLVNLTQVVEEYPEQQQVAIDLGYTTSSSFVTMIRKALGTSPARYMAHRLDHP